MSRTLPLLPLLILALLAAPGSASAAVRLDPAERGLVHRLNAVRGQYRLPALHASRALQRAADRHSADMGRYGFFDHVSSDGTSFDVRVRRQVGRATVGETLARTPRRGRASLVVAMWLQSPPHRAVILSGAFRRVGIARRSTGGQTVWTADFAS